MLDYAILHYTARLLNNGEAPTASNTVNECSPQQREDLRNRHNQAIQELKTKLKESIMKDTAKMEARMTQIREEYKIKRTSMKYTGSKSTAELRQATVIHSTRRDTND